MFCRLAVAELLSQASRGAVSASVAGPSGWVNKARRLNRTFVNNTVLQAVAGNRRADKEERRRARRRAKEALKEEKERRGKSRKDKK